MKTVFSAVMAMFLMTLAPSAQALQIENTSGWKLKYVPKTDKSFSFFAAGAEALLVPENDETGLNPAILVLKKPKLEKNLSDNKALWRAAVFPKFSYNRFVLHDEVFKHEDGWRYVVEFQSDTGSENMLPAIILATLVNDELYLFLFENHTKVFHQHLPSVEKIYRELRIKN